MNFPRVPLLRRDIRAVTGSALLRRARLDEGELDLLAGCPPCQGFSALRTKGQQSAVDDDRNDLLLEFLRLTEETLPRFVLLENVPGLARDGLFRQFTDGLQALGYDVTKDVLDSADFGTPQRRRRLVLVAGLESQPRLRQGEAERVTVRDAIGEYASSAGRSGDPLHDHGEHRAEHVRSVIESIPKDGGSRADLGADKQLECHRQAEAEGAGWAREPYPSKGRFLHPDENRAITLREALLLQGFPADHRLSMKRGKYAAAELIGNAIPPPFVRAQALPLRQATAIVRGAAP